jgi:photosystem II stability/assembly factor-like uncharacterized protein
LRKRFKLSGPVFLGHIVHHAIVDPRDGRTQLVGLRTGHLGPTVFRSTDFGATWQESTRPPAFSKPKDARRSTTVEQVFWLAPGHASEPGIWYAGTSPEGLFRSEDGGATWQPVPGWNDHPKWLEWTGDMKERNPDGSPHPRDPNSAWVFPMDGTDVWPRTCPGGKPAVYRTRDGGETWTRLACGFPERAWYTVLRQSMAVDAQSEIGVYVGTTNGEVWGSTDEGERWRCLASHLPHIYCLEAAEFAS